MQLGKWQLIRDKRAEEFETVAEMADEHSGDLVARWRAGDQQAAEQLFRRYTGRLIALARSRLPALVSRRVDAEDVVQSVYRSFFAEARSGHYATVIGPWTH